MRHLLSLFLAVTGILCLGAAWVQAEENAPAQNNEEGGQDGPNFRKIYNRFQNMSPDDKKKFLAEHPHFRERFRNALENRGEKLENRGERLDNKGERMQERGEEIGGERGERLERRGERVERRGERMERRAERVERRGERMERRGERMQRRAAGPRGGGR